MKRLTKMSCIEIQDTISMCISIFPHTSLDYRGHEKDGPGFAQPMLATAKSVHYIAKLTPKQESQSMIPNRIMVHPGYDPFNRKHDRVHLDGMARSSRWTG